MILHGNPSPSVFGPSVEASCSHYERAQDFEKLLKRAGPRCGNHGKEGRAGPEHGPPCGGSSKDGHDAGKGAQTSRRPASRSPADASCPAELK